MRVGFEYIPHRNLPAKQSDLSPVLLKRKLFYLEGVRTKLGSKIRKNLSLSSVWLLCQEVLMIMKKVFKANPQQS